MGYKEIINSPGLWIVSSFIVIISVSQAIVFMKSAIREADELGIDKEKRKSAIRSATFTAIGPSLAPVITLLTMVAIVGAPTTWMRLCDVGAARSEIGVLSITSSLTGAEIGTSSFGLEAFSNGLWGMALNNFGWLFVVFILGHRMGNVVTKMNSKYDPKWVKKLMGGATIGLFAFLLCNQVSTYTMDKFLPAIASAVSMSIFSSVFKKNKRLQEVALGVSMLIGMFVSQAVLGGAA